MSDKLEVIKDVEIPGSDKHDSEVIGVIKNIDDKKIETVELTKLDFSIDVSEFTCNICTDILFEPATLHCGHTFCLSCLKGAAREGEIRVCPGCASELNIPFDNLKKNIKFHNMMVSIPGYKERIEKHEKHSKYHDLREKLNDTKLYCDVHDSICKIIMMSKYIHIENLLQSLYIDFDTSILKSVEEQTLLINIILISLLEDEKIKIMNDVIYANHFEKVVYRYIRDNMLSLSCTEICHLIGLKSENVHVCNLSRELENFETKNRSAIFILLNKMVDLKNYRRYAKTVEIGPSTLEIFDDPDDDPLEGAL